ncbi:response regulator [Spirulina subsalsa]|nr:response regulator [Spirulina subsalsa]
MSIYPAQEVTAPGLSCQINPSGHFSCHSSHITQVLLITTDPDQLLIHQMALEMTTSWTVLTANSPSEALELARSAKPDVILWDFELMPSSLDLLTSLRANAETTLIPIIILLERVRLFDQHYFASLGVAGIIGKPFDVANLNQCIENFL